MKDTLFDIPEEDLGPIRTETCKTCKHRERWECGGSVFQYCGARGSNRTANGKLKIKCKTPACGLYKEDVK